MKQLEQEKIKSWWNLHSLSYQKTYKISTEEVYYGGYTAGEKHLKLLGNVQAKKILELGCGGGQASIALAKLGAECTGIDFSDEQIKYARFLNFYENTNVKFVEDDIQHLITQPSNYYDTALSIFALQFVPDLVACFKQTYRSLKAGGSFVFSLDHPFYLTVLPQSFKIYNIYFSTGQFDGISGDALVKDEYSDWDNEFIIYKRKVSDITNALSESGFLIQKILEPYIPESQDPWKSMYSPSLVSLIGPTIIFKAIKI